MENENSTLQALVAQHTDIEPRKRFLGLITDLVYKPTGSKLRFRDHYYGPQQSADIKNLFACSEDALTRLAARTDRPRSTQNGNLRLETAFSEDLQFVAIRLSQFSSLLYNPITDVRFLTGASARALCQFLA
ncbi:MAG: hypothetical protein IJ581_01285 [Paludibacteraceae bacterium]|nr:hypothetical protein [Paludibacteraceae bacterium]